MIGIGKSLGKIRKKIVPDHVVRRQMVREGIGVVVERWSIQARTHQRHCCEGLLPREHVSQQHATIILWHLQRLFVYRRDDRANLFFIN